MVIVICDDNIESSNLTAEKLIEEYRGSEIRYMKDPLLACKFVIIKGANLFVCRRYHKRINGNQIKNIINNSRPDVNVRFIEDIIY